MSYENHEKSKDFSTSNTSYSKQARIGQAINIVAHQFIAKNMSLLDNTLYFKKEVKDVVKLIETIQEELK